LTVAILGATLYLYYKSLASPSNHVGFDMHNTFCCL